MKKLYIDTSTDVMYIVLADKNEIIDTDKYLGKRDHATFLVDRIDQMLSKHHLKLDDLSEIIVGEGPGSYTGIRVAATVSKTLCYAKNIPLFAVSSLIFLTSGYKGKISAFHDARRGYVFACIYEGNQVYMKSQYILLENVIKHTLYKDTMPVYIHEDQGKIDIEIIDQHKYDIKDVHMFEPNYARITEAESNAS